jgi:hypothetical protein
MKRNEKERCKLNIKMYGILSLLMLLPLALLMAACAVTGLNKWDGDTALSGKGGAGIQDNGVNVVMSDAGEGHSPDSDAGEGHSPDSNAGEGHSLDSDAGEGHSLDSDAREGHSLDGDAGEGHSPDSNAGDGHSLDAADGSPKDALFVTNKGNVGIGTVTPSEKLSVNGAIESASGGFKFPDGTVQTTAAISKYQRIKRWKKGGVITFKPGQSKSVVAGCPKGTKALGGGGGFHQHSGPIAIIASYSRLKGTQWIVVFKNLGSENGSADLFTEVICATMD